MVLQLQSPLTSQPQALSLLGKNKKRIRNLGGKADSVAFPSLFIPFPEDLLHGVDNLAEAQAACFLFMTKSPILVPKL